MVVAFPYALQNAGNGAACITSCNAAIIKKLV
jgi:hypothetical protein